MPERIPVSDDVLRENFRRSGDLLDAAIMAIATVGIESVQTSRQEGLAVSHTLIPIVEAIDTVRHAIAEFAESE